MLTFQGDFSGQFTDQSSEVLKSGEENQHPPHFKVQFLPPRNDCVSVTCSLPLSRQYYVLDQHHPHRGGARYQYGKSMRIRGN